MNSRMDITEPFSESAIIFPKHHQNGVPSAFVLQVSFQWHCQSLIYPDVCEHPKSLPLPNGSKLSNPEKGKIQLEN